MWAGSPGGKLLPSSPSGCFHPAALAAADSVTSRTAGSDASRFSHSNSPVPPARCTLGHLDLGMKPIACFPQFQHKHPGDHSACAAVLPTHCFLKNSSSAHIWSTGRKPRKTPCEERTPCTVFPLSVLYVLALRISMLSC